MCPRAVLPFLVLLLASLAACSGGRDAEAVNVAIIGEPEDLFETGLRLPPPAQLVQAATTEGLVALDADGQIVPALAERWIVTDDGLSYIFRLRNSDWPGSDPISAEEVRNSLRTTLRNLRGTSLGRNFEAVSEIRAMTGRVIEVRLSTPVPDFLRLMAQPELGIRHDGRGAGPMTTERTEGDGLVVRAMPPEERGLPKDPGWRSRVLNVRALPAPEAVEAFKAGEVDLVLGGTLANLPLADVGPLSRGTVRLDAAQGLFGLEIVEQEGLLADPARREALAMAIDREALLAPFNIAGWSPTTRLIPAGLPGDQGTIGERWETLTIEERRAEARRRVAGWADEEGEPARLRVALPQGPGSRLLFEQLRADWATIGVEARLVPFGEDADLRLVDSLARYADPRWYLDQFGCEVRPRVCSGDADALVSAANDEPDPLARSALLAEAEAELTASNLYIPLGTPVRWSLVRGDISGFAENVWSFHPLFPLSLRPN